MSNPSRRNKARRGALVGCAVAALLAFAPAHSAQQIVPANFFERIPSGGQGEMAVAADTLVFDQRAGTVTAQGNVGISFEGFRATADRAVYHQTSGRVELVGNVAFIDPDGVEYIADRVELEDGFREGFLRSLTVAFPDGTYFSAAETSFNEGVERVYVDGIYAPCGTCIDANGNRIGWTVSAARIITDEAEEIIYFEQPSLQLLGYTVLRLPWLSLPTDPDLEFPVFSYEERRGFGVALPFFSYRIAGGTLDVTPAAYSNQGPAIMLDWRQRVGDVSYTVRTAAVYQFNPEVYSGLAEREFRGAIQTNGTFTPTDEWTLGWSYTAFTDPGFLPDYDIASGTARNQVYATYLDTDTHADIRVQQFVPLDNQSSWDAQQAAMDRQAFTHPNARFDRVVDLDEAGRIELTGRLLGLTRGADHAGSGYVYGYEGQSVHAMMQASWTNQFIVPGGLAVSPYLGLRADGAGYDGASGRADAPEAQTLLSATPIAALDIRYPLLARMPGATHVIEPIAQLVYRGGPALPGITNTDSQTFVFDDTNLFSFNRFSGADRQETGLRANIGGQMLTSFDNGAWLGVLAGQSFHLAGENAFNFDDGTPAGAGSGMNADASYFVAGIQGGYESLSGGVKLQLDPETGDIPRAQVSAAGSPLEGYRLTADYLFISENAGPGSGRDRHEINLGATVPLADYWSATANVAWDLDAGEWLETRASLQYDDRYLAFGVGARATGATHRSPEDFSIGVNFRLSGAQRQEIIGFRYTFDDF